MVREVNDQRHDVTNYYVKIPFSEFVFVISPCESMDFLQTFATNASWNIDGLNSFWGQKVMVTA